MKDIMTLLMEGRSMDEIAQMMTDELNATKAKYDAQKKKEEEERLAAEQATNRRALVSNICTAVCDYLKYAGTDDFVNDFFTNITDEDLDKIANQLDDFVKMTSIFSSLSSNAPVDIAEAVKSVKPEVKLPPNAFKTYRFDDPIEAFLNSKVRQPR